MSIKDNFNEDDWFRIQSAPSLVGSAIASAGRSGAMGTMKEIMASARTSIEASNDYASNGLIQAIVEKPNLEGMSREDKKAYMQEMQQKAMSSMGDIKSPEQLSDHAISELSAVLGMLGGHASANEISEFKAWVMQIGVAVAEAAKEGGFLGFGGERVSDAEEALLGRVSAVFDDGSFGWTN